MLFLTAKVYDTAGIFEVRSRQIRHICGTNRLRVRGPSSNWGL